MRIFISLLPLTLLAFACSTPAGPSTPSESPVQSDTQEAPICASLGELACLASADCTLEKDDTAQGGYLCRPALAPCEAGFRQQTDGADLCESREGCSFVPGNCYCSPDVVCICGGGPPPTCKQVS